MSIPDNVRRELREKLWRIAEEVGWTSLRPNDKAKYYENWTRDLEIGGVLARYIDKGKVRVYLKDTLLKDYAREITADEARPLRVLGINPTPEVEVRFIKPHGLRLKDGRVISWGRADDWKLILLAVYERAYAIAGATPFGAVLSNATGRFDEQSSHIMIEEAARLLGIQQVVWLRT